MGPLAIACHPPVKCAFEEVNHIDPTNRVARISRREKIEGDNGDLTGTYLGMNKRPILDEPHGGTGGNAIIGGDVERGTEFPERVGDSLFADTISRRVW